MGALHYFNKLKFRKKILKIVLSSFNIDLKNLYLGGNID